MLTNWKTTAAGTAAILGAAGDFLLQLSSGHIDPTRLMADWTALTTGIGLLFAKDSNVTNAAPSVQVQSTVAKK